MGKRTAIAMVALESTSICTGAKMAKDADLPSTRIFQVIGLAGVMVSTFLVTIAMIRCVPNSITNPSVVSLAASAIGALTLFPFMQNLDVVGSVTALQNKGYTSLAVE